MILDFLQKKGMAELILNLNQQDPKRFRELKKAITREGTLSTRIAELEKLKIIETRPVQDGRRQFFGYVLTKRGTIIKQKLKELEQI